MLRVNKVSEYGVLALGFISNQNQAVSAREIAAGLKLPYEITAKTLQRLKEAGYVKSTKGIKGGYKLTSSLSDITCAQIIAAIEGPKALADCGCAMQDGMHKLHSRLRAVLEDLKLSDLLGGGR